MKLKYPFITKVLLLKNKSEGEQKIQNNIRGEVQTTMNNKFMAFASVSNNLIERQRSEYDKRHMEYFINEKYISKLSLKIFQV